MNVFIRSDQFDRWLSALKDKVAKARILQRLDAAMAGNFGDCEPIGEGVLEMRIHVGPGYRVYYTRALRECICCCSVVTNPLRNETSSAQSKWREQ
jgi:putative addiction module killer protein